MVQSDQNRRQTLIFKAYEGDPLAAFLIEHGWPSWMFAAVFVLAYIVALYSGELVHWYKSDLDYALSGGIWGWAAMVSFIVVVGGFGSIFYLYVSGKAGSIYQELVEAGVIDGSQVKVRDLINGPVKSISTLNNKSLWLIIAGLLLVCSVILTLYIQVINQNAGEVTRYRSLGVLISMPVWLIGIYMVWMIVTRCGTTIWGLFKVLRVEQVEVQPLHPDRCGGLGAVRNFALALSYVIAVFGVAIIMFAFITSQGPNLCARQIETENIVRLEADCENRLGELKDKGLVTEVDGGGFIIHSTKLAKATSTVQTNLDRTFGLPPMWIFIILYVIIAPGAFFGTLWVAHGPMKRVRTELIQNLSHQFNEEYKLVRGHLPARSGSNETRLNNLRRIHELHGITAGFPVWPWNLGSIGQFAAANVPPLALATAGFVVNKFFL